MLSKIGRAFKDPLTGENAAIVGGVLLAAGTVGYVAYRFLLGDNVHASQTLHPVTGQSGATLPSSSKSFDYEGRLASLRRHISDHLGERFMAKEDIIEIQHLVAEKCAQEFVQIELEGRKKRREYLDKDMEKYSLEVVNQLKAVENTVSKRTKEVLRDLGVEYEWYEESVGRYAGFHETFLEEVEKPLEDLKLRMPINKDAPKLTKELAVKVFKFAIENHYSYQPDNMEYYMDIKQAYINDKLFKEMGMEEEDQLRQPECLEFPEVRPLIEQYQHVVAMDQENLAHAKGYYD